MDEPRRRISRLRLSVAGDDRAYVPVEVGDTPRTTATPSTTRGVSVREEWASATTPLARSTATRRSSLVAGAGAPLSPRGAPLREEAPAYDGDKKAAQRSAARTRLLRTVAAAALLCVVVAVVGGIFAVHKRGGGAASADVHAPVSAQATLGGYALASFTPLASQAFVASVAAGAGVASADVAGEKGGGDVEGPKRRAVLRSRRGFVYLFVALCASPLRVSLFFLLLVQCCGRAPSPPRPHRLRRAAPCCRRRRRRRLSSSSRRRRALTLFWWRSLCRRRPTRRPQIPPTWAPRRPRPPPPPPCPRFSPPLVPPRSVRPSERR